MRKLPYLPISYGQHRFLLVHLAPVRHRARPSWTWRFSAPGFPCDLQSSTCTMTLSRPSRMYSGRIFLRLRGSFCLHDPWFSIQCRRNHHRALRKLGLDLFRCRRVDNNKNEAGERKIRNNYEWMNFDILVLRTHFWSSFKVAILSLCIDGCDICLWDVEQF